MNANPTTQIKSLKILSYITDFLAKPYDDQKELLQNLLNTEVGKKLIDEAILKSNVDKLAIIFETYHEPILIFLFKTSSNAQKYLCSRSIFSEYMYDNHSMVRSLYDFFRNCYDMTVMISEDNKYVAFDKYNSLYFEHKDFIIYSKLDSNEDHDIKLYKRTNFNFNDYTKSKNYNSDNILLLKKINDNNELKLTSWWSYY